MFNFTYNLIHLDHTHHMLHREQHTCCEIKELRFYSWRQNKKKKTKGLSVVCYYECMVLLSISFLLSDVIIIFISIFFLSKWVHVVENGSKLLLPIKIILLFLLTKRSRELKWCTKYNLFQTIKNWLKSRFSISWINSTC